MQITTFTPDDIHPFLALARDEGWISHRRELAFLLEKSPQGCLVCHEEGRPVGFVTAVSHGHSGWIGNLLVGAINRGRGIGTALFHKALQGLKDLGTATVWLTASSAGRPIYEKAGFRICDKIRRWEKPGAGQVHLPATMSIPDDWLEIDYLGWGDSRTELLSYAAVGGSAISASDGFLVMQRLGNGHQIGPFGALNGKTAEALLDQALKSAGRALIDTPGSNRAAGKLLTSRGFTVSSEVDLMYAGQPPAYHPEHIFGLASMGSMG